MRISNNTKLNFKRIIALLKLVNLPLILFGILLIVFSDKVINVLHWVVGSAMLFAGVWIGIAGFLQRNKRRSVNNLTAAAVLLILGVIIFTQRENSVGTIMIVWGLIGVFNGCNRLFAFIRMAEKRGVYALIELITSLVDAALGVTLLINPYQDVQLHIILLGVELIVISLKITEIGVFALMQKLSKKHKQAKKKQVASKLADKTYEDKKVSVAQVEGTAQSEDMTVELPTEEGTAEMPSVTVTVELSAKQTGAELAGENGDATSSARLETIAE